MLIDLHDKLSLRSWERALFQFPYTVEEGWSVRLKEEGLIVDLSKVGWVEPAALVRAVLLIEGALLNGANVTVRLPRTKSTKAERRILQSAKTSKDSTLRDKASHTSAVIKRRGQAAAVLEHMRLKDALLHEHLRAASGNLEIVEEFDWSLNEGTNVSHRSEVAKELVTDTTTEALIPWYFKVAYGLQWIPDPRSESGKTVINHLAEVNVLADMLAHPSGRISSADSRTLAHVFLKELIENAIDHSGRQFALIAAWSRPNTVSLKETEILECEREFASWCRGYPLLEVIVGDSGDGIPQTLRSEYRKRQRPCPPRVNDGAENDCILAWAFDKWSSRVSLEQKRGTRGLYRVARIVRKYDGCITLRSELSYVGIDNGHSNPPEYIVERQRLARSPGTVVHVRLPVMLSEKMPERPFQPALNESDFRVLQFYDLDWQEGSTIISSISDRIFSACKEVSFKTKPTCVIADFGFATVERRFLEDLLRELVEIAHPVAVVVANIQGPSWDSSRETIHSISQQINYDGAHVSTAEHQDAIYVQDAILFLHADGRFAWVGVPEDIAGLFGHLWEKGKLSSDELKQFVPDTHQRNDVLRQFGEAYHVAVRLPEGGLSLRFNRTDILEQLHNHTAERVRKVVEDAPAPAVLSGVCRTPSLGLVSRYVNIDPLLQLLGLDRATGILAQKCGQLHSLQQPDRVIQIIANWKTNRTILEKFKSHLLNILSFPLNIEINQVSPRDLPVIDEDALVVLFTSVILTGDSATSLLSQVIRARRIPAVVVSVLDARPEPMKPLKTLGHTIDAVSLANVDVSVPEPIRAEAERSGKIININPLSHLPERNLNTKEQEYPISISELTKIINKQDALYFNHIVRPNGRHFCFYLDAFKLLGSLDTADTSNISSTGREVTTYMMKEIDEWLEANSSLDLFCIPNFPRSEKPSAAEVLAKELAPHYNSQIQAISPSGDFIPLLKNSKIMSAAKRKQLVLKAPKQEQFRRVVILDWGSVTGKNIRDSIRFAVGRGAKQILVLVFLSQLPVDDEQFLSQIRRVKSPVAQDNGNHDDCEVSVKFIARFPIQAYDELHCPYCRQIERLNKEKAFHSSGLLQEFLTKSMRRLSARTLQEVREEREKYLSQAEGRTLLTEETDPTHNVIKIAEIRGELDKAREWTSARFKFYRILLRADKAVEENNTQAKLWRACLIRLLATEWTWLKHEPLSLSSFKRPVADLAIKQILDESCADGDRRDAIVVLRTVSKERFAKHLSELFIALIANTELLSQLLYGAFTYLHREYLLAESLRPLVDSLEECATEVRKKLGLSISTEVGQTINALNLLGTYVSETPHEQTLSPIEAWKELKREWADKYDAHHPLAESIRNLFLSYFEDELLDTTKVLPDIDWKDIRDKWNLVERHLIHILSWLEPLQSVFEGLDTCGYLLAGEGEKLAQASTDEGLSRIATLRTQLDLFSNAPIRVRTFGEWEAFIRERTWLWELLLNPGTEKDGERIDASTLITVLKGCPCDLRSALERVLKDPFPNVQAYNVQLDDGAEEDADVFCHEVVLIGCLRELFFNIERHTIKADEKIINILVSVKEEWPYIVVKVKNDGKAQSSRGTKRGLIRFKQALQAYGGDLTGREIKESEAGAEHRAALNSATRPNDKISWSYEAVITILRW